MTTFAAQSHVFFGAAPLRHLPVQHACAHYEARLTRWTNPADEERGYMLAGSPCSTCEPQGRPVQTQYHALADVQDGCQLQDRETERGAYSLLQ